MRRALAPILTCTALLLLGRPLHAQDGLPKNAISFFNTVRCPVGWGPLELAHGRFTVPAMPGGGNGGTVGEPLKGGADPTHTHDIESKISLTEQSFIAFASCCNTNPAEDGDARFSGVTKEASTGLPYVELLLCIKEADPAPDAPPVPSGTLIYTGFFACPSGWSDALGTQGRFLVGLPDKGVPGIAFGGNPLQPLEDRVHRHAFSGTVSLPGHELAIGSGCCGDGFGRKGDYSYGADSSADDSGLPYIQLLQCQKN